MEDGLRTIKEFIFDSFPRRKEAIGVKVTILNGSLTSDNEDAMDGSMGDGLKVSSLYFLMVLFHDFFISSVKLLYQELGSFLPSKLGRNIIFRRF